MKHKQPYTRVWNGEGTDLLLFPDESSAPSTAPRLTNAPPTPERFPLRNVPLSGTHHRRVASAADSSGGVVVASWRLSSPLVSLSG